MSTMRFMLVIYPDHKAILTTPDSLTPSHAQAIHDAFTIWQASDEAKTLVIGDCDVVVVEEIELEIPGLGLTN